MDKLLHMEDVEMRECLEARISIRTEIQVGILPVSSLIQLSYFFGRQTQLSWSTRLAKVFFWSRDQLINAPLISLRYV